MIQLNWYVWLISAYVLCMIIVLLYLHRFLTHSYAKVLNRKVAVRDIHVARIILSVILQPIGVILVIVNEIIFRIDYKRHKKENL